MKILSAILATLILFLTVQPVLTNSNFIAQKGAKAVDKCCTHKQNPQLPKKQQDEDNNCCNKGHCDNPFLTCANCYFINLDKSAFSLIQVSMQTEKISFITEKILSSYIQAFWHPPEFV